MKPYNAQTVGRYVRISLTILTLLALGLAVKFDLFSTLASATSSESIPNNQPVRNPNGKSATFSTQGSVNLTGEYFQAQGTNGRSCASCHIPEEAWSINPCTLQHLFDETAGTHPIFNL
ncbi:MAG TPA: hypothetical protein VF074_21385, partial [Pyrinomonadaceae bacterium]